MGSLALCSNSSSLHFNSTPPFNRHNLTVGVEVAGSGLSLTLCVAFFTVFALLRCRRCAPRLEALYSWPSVGRIVSLSAVAALQSATFFFSSVYGFSPATADPDLCRGQGIAYQFATSAISVEVFAVSFAAYQTIVRGVSFKQLRRTHSPWLFACVYGVALLNTVIPYVVERVTGVRVFGLVDHVSGYCWMNFQRECLHIFVYFYYTLQFLSHFASLVLFVRIGLRACRLQVHLRGQARSAIKLFILRRVFMLSIAAVYFFVSLTYAVMTWLGVSRQNAAWDTFMAVDAFLQAAAGSLYLLPFLLPDCAYRPLIEGRVRRAAQRVDDAEQYYSGDDDYQPARAYRALSTPVND